MGTLGYMGGRGRGSWQRLFLVGALIAVLAFGLGFALRGAGLSDAANFAQLLSLIPLMVGAISWMQARRGARQAADDHLARLSELFRLIADAQGLTREDVRTRMQDKFGGDSVDAYLSGAIRPDWEFVTEFLRVVVGDDRWRRELLERRVRPLWEAASDATSYASSTGGKPDYIIIGQPATQPASGDWTSQVPRLRSPGRIPPRLLIISIGGTVIAFVGMLIALRAFSGPGPAVAEHSPHAQPAFIWAHATGGVVASSPVVVGDTVYVGSEDGKVYALNAATGHVRWSHATQRYIWSSPAVADGTVYIGSGDGKVYALRATTGHIRWTYATGAAVNSSPAVADGTVYVGSKNGVVYALSAATGHVRWTYATGAAVISSPVVADGSIYIGSEDHKVYALTAATGDVRWTRVTGRPVTSSPAVTSGTVYIGSQDDKVYALYAATGHTRWVFPTGGPVYSSPTVAGGVVYVGSRDRKVYALNASTGHVIWTYTTKSNVESRPAVAGDTVYVGSDDFNVYALKATTGYARWVYRTGNMVFSSPVVAGKTVYVGSRDYEVYALNAATGL